MNVTLMDMTALFNRAKSLQAPLLLRAVTISPCSWSQHGGYKTMSCLLLEFSYHHVFSQAPSRPDSVETTPTLEVNW